MSELFALLENVLMRSSISECELNPTTLSVIERSKEVS